MVVVSEDYGYVEVGIVDIYNLYNDNVIVSVIVCFWLFD